MPLKRKAWLEKYRQHLEKAREEIVVKIQRTANDGRQENVWVEPSDSADLALSSYTKEFLYGLTNVERGQFIEIEAALRRIQEGSYGTCIDCGNELPARRLEVVPWACRCTTCQESFEQAQQEEEQVGREEETEEVA